MILQRRNKQISELTKALLASELTPMAVLRQLSYENCTLTDQFTKFYEHVPDHSDEEDSDMENDDISSQSTSSYSQIASSQSTIGEDDENVMSQSNTIASQKVSSGNSVCTSLDNSPSHFARPDKRTSSAMESDELQNNPSKRTKRTASEPNLSVYDFRDEDEENSQPNGRYIDGVRIRQFQVLVPSIRQALLEIENNSHKKGMCGICQLKPYEMMTIPCGHLSCKSCFDEWKNKFRNDLQAKYKSARTIEKHMSELTCMFCRKVVKSVNSAL